MEHEKKILNGLDFHWEISGKRGMGYSINTAVYSLSADNDWFASSISSDRVEFLSLIKQERIVFGTVKNRPTLVIPLKEAAVVIRKNRILGWSGQRHKDPSKLMSGADFRSIT